MHIFDSLLLCVAVILYPAVAMLLPGAVAEAAKAEAAQTQSAPADNATAEPDFANTPARPVELQDVFEEIAELRAQVLRMQQTLDTWLDTSLVELKAENEQLRRELREAFRAAGRAAPAVPTPDGGLLRDVLGEFYPDEMAEAVEIEVPIDAELADAVASSGYLAVTEWGLNPEEAADFDPPRASLRGLIGVALPGTPEDELKDLGRRMRNEADGYDNINIELFNDRAAAEAFKNGLSVDPSHRVLSVQRHKASGRDVILLLGGEIPVEVTLEGQTASESAQ